MLGARPVSGWLYARRNVLDNYVKWHVFSCCAQLVPGADYSSVEAPLRRKSISNVGAVIFSDRDRISVEEEVAGVLQGVHLLLGLGGMLAAAPWYSMQVSFFSNFDDSRKLLEGGARDVSSGRACLSDKDAGWDRWKQWQVAHTSRPRVINDVCTGAGVLRRFRAKESGIADRRLMSELTAGVEWEVVMSIVDGAPGASLSNAGQVVAGYESWCSLVVLGAVRGSLVRVEGRPRQRGRENSSISVGDLWIQ